MRIQYQVPHERSAYRTVRITVHIITQVQVHRIERAITALP